MKKIFTYSIGALFLASALSLGSCKSQADDDLTRRTEQSINQGTPVVFTFDMESLPEQDARILTIESQTAGGKNAGIKQKWVDGDTETIYLLFKQGTKTEVVTTTMTIGSYNESTKRYEGKFEVTPPSTIDLTAGDVTVAGAMGVTALTDTGEATIASSNFFGEADRFMTLPMYFTERPVTYNGTKYVADMTLHFFGSVVGVTVSNVDGNMTYSPHEVTFKTEAFTTKGTMNILAASEANSAKGTDEVLPTWTTEQTIATEQRVGFDHGDIKIGEKKTLFFWVHPSTYTGTKTLELDMRTDNYDENLGSTDPEITKSFNVKPLSQRRVHRIAQELQAPKGDLIISEVYMGAIPGNVIWEFYNPTETEIDLSKYELWRYDYNTTTKKYPAAPTYTAKLTDFSKLIKFFKGDNTMTKLPSHKNVLYWPGTTIAPTRDQEARPGILYIANHRVAGGDWEALKIPHYIIKSRLSPRYALVKKGDDGNYEIVDNFFYGDDNVGYKIPKGNFMRKPGRNLPRTTMKIDIRNSDWVMRTSTSQCDLGYRYSYYYDRNRLDGTYYGNHWLEDTQNNGAGELGKTIYNVDYSVDAERSTPGRATQLPYTPPTWWTKARATAADKQ